MLLSSFFGKKVLTGGRAEFAGFVKGVVLDPETYVLRAIYTDKHMFIPWEEIVIGESILIAAHMRKEAFVLNGHMFSPGAEIYSAKGKFIGKLLDIELKSGRKTLITDAGGISVKRVAGASGEFVVLMKRLIGATLGAGGSAAIRKIEGADNRESSPTGETVFPDADMSEASENKVGSGGDEGAKIEIVTPDSDEKAYAGNGFYGANSGDNPVSPITRTESRFAETFPREYSGLIGKCTTKELTDIQRSFVVVAGTVVTEKLLENARKAGKLAELVSKTTN